jgi:phosphoenolpyruvate synthase/pyruvate phosphate dikinase
VPPGFTITTEVCVDFYERGKKLPAELRADRSPTALANVEQEMGSGSAIRSDRCWCRSARARAPRCRA